MNHKSGSILCLVICGLLSLIVAIILYFINKKDEGKTVSSNTFISEIFRGYFIVVLGIIGALSLLSACIIAIADKSKN